MEKKPISSLNDAIMLVQLEDFVTNFDNKMNKQMKKDKKAFLLALIPVGLGVIVSIFTKNPLFMVGGTTCMGIGAIIKNLSDEKEHDREFNRYLESLNPSSKIVSLDSEKPIDILLHDKINFRKGSDFYTDEVKEFIEEENNKYQRPHLIQEENVEEKEEQEKTPLVENENTEETILGKEETMEQIVYEYELYCKIYNIPKMPISVREWNTLFDVVYNRLKEISLEDKLYEYMSFLQRYTFAYALLHKQSSITIYSYLNQIPMLEKVGFTGLDIESIIKEINSILNGTNNKVISFKKALKANKGQN